MGTHIQLTETTNELARAGFGDGAQEPGPLTAILFTCLHDLRAAPPEST